MVYFSLDIFDIPFVWVPHFSAVELHEIIFCLPHCWRLSKWI